MQEFSREKQKLNAAQLQAVECIEGPVLVVAGPGTGKTKLLSMRVANILHKTDTDASSILCLTFTNKAATNMRNRLLQLMGPQARDVTVKTFHSFAAEIMNLYPDYFWKGARLSTAPDAVLLEIIHSIISELPIDNPLALKFAGSYTAVSDIQNALKLTKEAGLTAGKLTALIEANLAFIDTIEPMLVTALDKPLSANKMDSLIQAIESLPDQAIDETVTPLLSLSTVIKESFSAAAGLDEGTGKTVNCGKWKRAFIQTVNGKRGMWEERKRNSWWLAVSDVYASYRNLLRKRGYYDYADMLVEVISQLERHPDMLAGIQERFLYVLIDEFQDTNAAQLRLAHLVSTHFSAGDQPNLMAVGDDDQSIFKFNGAELNNLLSFNRMYPAAKRFVLEENYRSSQAILNTAKLIIEQAQERLVTREAALTKNLRAANEPKVKGIIQHLSYPTCEHQRIAAAKLAKKVLGRGNSSVAVLARSHESLRELASILIRLKVPVHYEQQSNVLDHEAVQQICLLAALVEAIRKGDEATVNQKLAQSLQHPMWELDPELLWRLALDNYHQPQWLESLLASSNNKLKSISAWLLWLARETAGMPVSLGMEYLIGLRKGEYMASPVRKYFMARRQIDNHYLHALSAIRLLRTLVNEFSHNQEASLADFLSFVDLNRENNKIIADESPFVTDKNAVQLLTVHKAKGLEFDYVIIIDAVEDSWKPRSGGRKAPANLPLQPYGDDYDDYVRLMYVAATRARHSLIITSYYQDHASKEVLAAPFVRNALETTIITPEIAEPPIEVLEQTLRWPRLESSNEQALLKSCLDTFSLSVTSLVNFLDVTAGGPRYYFERNVLRLPDIKTASLSHGTAMHSALEVAQILVNQGSFDLNKVLLEYEKALSNEHLPKTELHRYLNHGKATLRNLFETNSLQLVKGSLPEQRLADIRIGNAVIGGKLDRIDKVDDKSIAVVDYKTGKPLPSFSTKNKNLAIKAWKQRTQLIFYALLMRETARYRGKTVEGKMVYLEAETPKDLYRSYWPSSEEISRLEKLIQTVWRHTMELDFPDTGLYSPDIKGITAFENDLIDGKI